MGRFQEALMHIAAGDLVVGPGLMPGHKIDPFCEGFGTVFSSLAAAEC